MKNNGISLIVLIITIVVIIILTAIFVATGLDALNEAKKSKTENEIAQIKKAIQNEYVDYLRNENQFNLTGSLAKNKWSNSNDCINVIISSLDIDDTEEKNLKIEKIKKEIPRDYNKFVKIIESGDMLKLGLENFSDDNSYIVNYNTNEVYGPLNK